MHVHYHPCNARHARLTDKPPPNDEKRNLLALPARLGGIAAVNPTKDTEATYMASSNISAPLKEAVLSNTSSYSYNIISTQQNLTVNDSLDPRPSL